MQKNRGTFLPAQFIILYCLILGSCSTTSAVSAGDTGPYDADSWKTLIADDCKSYFDGCNNCRRAGLGSSGLRYWADSPDSGPEGWGLRLTFVLLYPR